ncbi:MAG: hypothetical protein H0U10_02375, partial [Chloroflexia bacterium]|nr:hypothetical protein [Chloroflexia bacterium]
TPVAGTEPSSPPPTGTDGSGFAGGDILSALGIVVGMALLWTGVNRIELNRFAKALFSLLDIALIGVSVVALGWPANGLLVLVTASVLTLITLTRLHVEHESTLARAAAVSRSTLPEMTALAKRLRRDHRVFRYLRSQTTAELINHLSDRARGIAEIEAMAPPIAALWIIDRPEMRKFVADFDRLLRLYRKRADQATAVADTVTAASQISPMTTQETIDALLSVAEAFPGSTDDPEDEDDPEEIEDTEDNEGEDTKG